MTEDKGDQNKSAPGRQAGAHKILGALALAVALLISAIFVRNFWFSLALGAAASVTFVGAIQMVREMRRTATSNGKLRDA